MFHLDRGRSGVDFDMVRDEIGRTISADGDDVRELEEDTNDFFPQTRIPLESRGLIQAKLRHQPLDLPFPGRASNSACVAASGGGELFEWSTVGVAVTSWTDPTRVHGIRSTSSHSRLSTSTDRLPSA